GAAVATPSPVGASIPSETVSTALRHGWAWKIPLTSRYGNGYVYSSQFCSADEAETELRQHLGLLESDAPARHLKMKIGRVTKHWNKNCLAVGLAQGFIEPLEATALLFIQETAATFVEFLEQGDMSEAHQLREPSAQEARYSLAEIDNLLERSCANYPDHRAALGSIAPRRTDAALQIYFW